MDAEKRQIGIVSFGEGCAEKKYPGVYARVSAVSSWLEHAMCMSLSHKPSDCSVLRLDLTYDGYPDETGWTLYDTEGNTLYESKAGSVRRTGQRSTLLNVRQGRSYHLRFTDTMGDGFCCK